MASDYTRDDALRARLAAGPGTGKAGKPVDDETLAALAEGRLKGRAARAVLEQVASDPQASRRLKLLRSSLPVKVSAGRPVWRMWTWFAASASVVTAAVALALLLRTATTPLTSEWDRIAKLPVPSVLLPSVALKSPGGCFMPSARDRPWTGAVLDRSIQLRLGSLLAELAELDASWTQALASLGHAPEVCSPINDPTLEAALDALGQAIAAELLRTATLCASGLRVEPAADSIRASWPLLMEVQGSAFLEASPDLVGDPSRLLSCEVADRGLKALLWP